MIPLQGSPWSSPRILSPVDVQHIINSRSSENLHILEAEIDFHASSPVRRRWARRSFRKKSPSPGKSRNHSIENSSKHEEAAREAEKMLKNEEEEVKSRLAELSNRNRLLTFFDFFFFVNWNRIFIFCEIWKTWKSQGVSAGLEKSWKLVAWLDQNFRRWLFL